MRQDGCTNVRVCVKENTAKITNTQMWDFVSKKIVKHTNVLVFLNEMTNAQM
jgi:hypothetical protein